MPFLSVRFLAVTRVDLKSLPEAGPGGQRSRSTIMEERHVKSALGLLGLIVLSNFCFADWGDLPWRVFNLHTHVSMPSFLAIEWVHFALTAACLYHAKRTNNLQVATPRPLGLTVVVACSFSSRQAFAGQRTIFSSTSCLYATISGVSNHTNQA